MRQGMHCIGLRRNAVSYEKCYKEFCGCAQEAYDKKITVTLIDGNGMLGMSMIVHNSVMGMRMSHGYDFLTDLIVNDLLTMNTIACRNSQIFSR